MAHPWSRTEFLAQHPEIAEALGECLSGLEFIQAAQRNSAVAAFSRRRPSDAIAPRPTG